MKIDTVLNFKSTFLNVLFPKKCEHCGDSFQEGLSNVLCRVCFDSITPYEDPVCEHCGISLPARSFEDAIKIRCRDCGEEPYYLDRVRAYGAYEGPLRIAHHAFKFEGMEGLARELATKMHDATYDIFWQGVECLVPVPQSPERVRERGYNPAVLLAGELSGKTKIPTKSLLKKIRATKPQMSLTREERFKNPRHAYQVTNGTTQMSKIILVDDVFTTGSTLEECAKILKKSGASWVGALVFGRTPRY